MSKVLIITHGFPPVQHSGTFRMAAFSKYLPEFGMEPVVFCASDDLNVLRYNQEVHGRGEASTPPTQRVEWAIGKMTTDAGGWDRLPWRFPLLYTKALRATRKRFLSRVLPTARATLMEHRPDVILASSPPPEALMIGRELSREFGVPLVCDLRDPWSYYSWARYRHRLDFELERRYERMLLSDAAHVFANTPSARKLLVSKVGVPEERVSVLTNGYDEREHVAASHVSRDRQHFVLAYTGLLSAAREGGAALRKKAKRLVGLDYQPVQSDPNTRSPRWLLRAVERLLDAHPEHREILRVQFTGAFHDHELADLESFRYPDCVEVFPPASRAKALECCHAADLLLLLQIEMLLDGRDFCTAVPGKLYDYLRSGTRILALVQPGDAANLVQATGAGIVVGPRNADAVSAALHHEIQRWEGGGQEKGAAPETISEYEWHHLTSVLAKQLDHVRSTPRT